MTAKKSILIIEDDDDIRELIKLQLEREGHLVSDAHNAQAGLEVSQIKNFDLLIVDRMLPDMKGTELCQTLRLLEVWKETPILMLTAMSENHDIIEGLDAGADDYITKPFDLNVLKARVRALLRRRQVGPRPLNAQKFEREGFCVDYSKRNVTVDNDIIGLTRSEFQILETLCRQPGIPKTREELVDIIAGDGVHVTKRIVDTHMAGLRKKIKRFGSLIETLRGVGYRIKEPNEKI